MGSVRRETNRYRDFLRKLASSLHPEAVGNPEGVVILDMEVQLRPVPPRRGTSEDIVFID